MKTKLCKEVCKRCWEVHYPGCWSRNPKEFLWKSKKEATCVAIHKTRLWVNSRVSIYDDIPDGCFYKLEHVVMREKHK